MAEIAPPAGLIALQRQIGERPDREDPERIREAGRLGISGASGPLPYLDKVQKAFGRHDVSGVAAHTDEAAAAGARAMGAAAFTMGNHVAFAGSPSLHTAAHEAAHAVQQRGGVELPGGVGQVGDRHEQHADEVARRVVQGEVSESLLDAYAGGERSWHDGPAQRQVAMASPSEVNLPREMPENRRANSSALVQRQGSEASLYEPRQYDSIRAILENRIQDWRVAAGDGVNQFVHNILAKRIDDIESGSMQQFALVFLGGALWSAACFATGGTAFAISVVGMSMQALPSLPKESSTDQITKIEERCFAHLNVVQERVHGQMRGWLVEYLEANPSATADSAEKEFLADWLERSYWQESENGCSVKMTDITESTKKSALDIWTRFNEQVVKIGDFYNAGAAVARTGAYWVATSDGTYLALVQTVSYHSSFTHLFIRWVDEDMADLVLAKTQSIGELPKLSLSGLVNEDKARGGPGSGKGRKRVIVLPTRAQPKLFPQGKADVIYEDE